MSATPGPWRINTEYVGRAAAAVESGDGGLIALVADDNPAAIANARLIAQAPRMYDVLAALVQPDAADNLIPLKGAAIEILEAIGGLQ